MEDNDLSGGPSEASSYSSPDQPGTMQDQGSIELPAPPHRPLGRIPGAMRVLRLLPDDIDGEIVCELQHVTVGDGTRYEAMSYGIDPNEDESDDDIIILDQQPFAVSNDLFNALLSLRVEDKVRVLWIECLCINRNDLAEQNEQVNNRLRSIYKSATNVIIWLGECSGGQHFRISVLFHFMHVLFKAHSDHDKLQLTSLVGLDEMWFQLHELGRLGRHTWFTNPWAFLDIASRPFPRLEPGEPGNMVPSPLLLYGQVSLPFSHLLGAYKSWVMDAHLGPVMPLPDVLPRLRRMLQIWERRQSPTGQPGPTYATQLTWYLAMTAGFSAKADVRECIIAIACLVSTEAMPVPYLLRMDSAKPCEGVLADCAIYLVSSGILDFPQYNSMIEPDLPSWVTDWKHAYTVRDWQTPRPHQRAYCSLRSCSDCNADSIKVKMYAVTTITKIGPPLSHRFSPDPDMARLDQWFYLLADAFIGQPLVQYIYKSYMEGIGKFLVAYDIKSRCLGRPGPSTAAPGAVADWRRAGAGLSWSRRGLHNLLGEDASSEGWRNVMKTLGRRLLFRCADGSVGLVDQAAAFAPEIGDVIGFIAGASAEFVLRPLGCRVSHGTYRIVGVAERNQAADGSTIRSFDVLDWATGDHLRRAIEALRARTEPVKVLIH